MGLPRNILPARLSRARLPLAVVGSLLIHTAVILPLFMASLNATTARSLTRANLHADDLAMPEQDDDEVKLGLAESSASTMTWVGFEDYEKHMAALADIEQAAFTVAPEQGTPVESPGEELIETTAVAEPSRSVEPGPPVPPIPPAMAEMPTAPAEPLEPTMNAERPTPAPSTVDSLMTLLTLVEQFAPVQELRERTETTANRPTANPTPSPVEPTPKPTHPEQPNGAAPKAGDLDSDEPTPGVVSDRQSSATSTIEFRDLKAGRPIAAEGLELKPRRPELTTFQRLTTNPCNPVVRIEFDAAGTPVRAAILRTSCDDRFDRALLASLYRWRAVGDRLNDLAADQTTAITLEILLR